MKEDKGKKRLFLPLFLGFILIASAFGVMISGFGSGKQQKVEYGGYNFVNINGRWNVNLQGTTFSFAYNPAQVENLEITPFPLAAFNSGAKVYITYDPSEYLSAGLTEMQTSLLPLISVKAFRACTKDVAGCENLPIKTCIDATGSEKIVVINQGDNLQTSYESNCYTLSGPDLDLAKAFDKIVFDSLQLKK